MRSVTDEQAKANIAANVRRLLDDREETPYRLAKETGEPINSIYRLIRGENVPGVGVLSRIADHFGVPVDELLGEISV